MKRIPFGLRLILITGSLTLYQKAQFQGDKLEVNKSIRQVTHSTEGRSIGSYQSTGN